MLKITLLKMGSRGSRDLQNVALYVHQGADVEGVGNVVSTLVFVGTNPANCLQCFDFLQCQIVDYNC